MSALKPPVKDKALAYVIRSTPAGPRVLVFDHEGEPGAGTQVPAGTVDAGETAEEACRRELQEEAGIAAPGPARFVGVFEYFSPKHGQLHRRHVFLFGAPSGVADVWTHVVSGEGNDRGRRFRCYWLDVAAAEATLAGDQGAYLGQGLERAGAHNARPTSGIG